MAGSKPEAHARLSLKTGLALFGSTLILMASSTNTAQLDGSGGSGSGCYPQALLDTADVLQALETVQFALAKIIMLSDN